MRFRALFADLGLDAKHLSLAPDRGGSDEAVIRQAIDEDRIVVTFDLDFGRLYYFHHRGRVGILLMRLSRLTFPGMEQRLRDFLKRVDLEARGFQRSLVILEAHRYRVLH